MGTFALKLSLGLLLTVVSHVIVAQTVPPTSNPTTMSTATMTMKGANKSDGIRHHHHKHHWGNDSESNNPNATFNFCGSQNTGAADIAKNNSRPYHNSLHDCRRRPLCPKEECLSSACRHQCSIERNHGVITETNQFDKVKFHELFTNNMDDFDRKQKLMDKIDTCGANKTFTTDNNCEVFAEFYLCVRKAFQQTCGTNQTAAEAAIS